MDTVLLSWRFQNIVTIALMVVLISLLTTLGAQAFRRMKNSEA